MTPSPGPYQVLGHALRTVSPLREAIAHASRGDEAARVQACLPDATFPPEQAAAIHALARQLAAHLRHRRVGTGRDGLVQALMQEFSLSTQEGIALMCMAEALLRIPDEATRDALIRDKIGDTDWSAHLGHSPSPFVNAATWGLMLTGKLVGTHGETGLRAALRRVAVKGGEPLIRKSVDVAMRLLGEQFVIGQTIQQALNHARQREAQGFLHSYDMLGEAALTDEDALRYVQAYEDAIEAIGRSVQGRANVGAKGGAEGSATGLGLYEGPGISVKLSALHPRYEQAQYTRVMDELYPRLLGLVKLAHQYNIGLNIDAEESERLSLSLDLLERLCLEPALHGWDGIGFVVQAYQKCCMQVLDELIALARRSGRRLMVRLVKGAYWDSEIKRAQTEGQRGYPVFTRKAHTDVAYLACARQMLAARAEIYPQFATHNAHTLAAVHQMAGPAFLPGQYEFQCLHGMGEPLYEQVVGAPDQGGLGRPCRIYAPVGTHETLLAYLVRRLLENGANSSFVNRVADAAVSLDELVADPATQIREAARQGAALGAPHARIPLPGRLFGAERLNAPGLDLNDQLTLAWLHRELARHAAQPAYAAPLVAQALPEPSSPALPVQNPGDTRELIGHVRHASLADVQQAAHASAAYATAWRDTPVAQRAHALEQAADLMAARMPQLMDLLIREAGKTLANAVGEVREAIDFLRYYAAQARAHLRDGIQQPLGPVACISPWNFPLAIFTGQIAAVLAAGNTVLAKPAEQTPLTAALATALLHEAGVPLAALQLLPGPGDTIGAALVAQPEIRAVMFTGSGEVARLLQAQLAERVNERGQPLVLIAETGGQNAMIVDSSALPEQVVHDVLTSAFDSAGQRCSALRVLCLQEDIAERVLNMLRGAMQAQRIGPSEHLHTDVGPLIDKDALKAVQGHVEAMRTGSHAVVQAPAALADVAAHGHGSFMAPTLIELNDLLALTHEVFGPVLHVLRFKASELATLVDRINALGYGLTLGIHSRIDEAIEAITRQARVGNVYVNRHMVGAVVGVQPFGGQGLSGTGPKAGGPLLLQRLLAPSVETAWSIQAGAQRATGDVSAAPDDTPLQAWLRWLNTARIPHAHALKVYSHWLQTQQLAGLDIALPGPAGEHNRYSLRPLGGILCLARDQAELLYQLATVLAADGHAIWHDRPGLQPLWLSLPAAIRSRITLVGDMGDAPFDAVLMHAAPADIIAMARQLAQRPGPIVRLQAAPRGWLQPGIFQLSGLLAEHVVSINTAAAGGNAGLLTLD